MRLRKWSIGVCAILGLVLCLTGCGQIEQTQTNNQATTLAVTVSASADSKSNATTLREVFEGDFKVGVATTSGYLSDEDRAAEIRENFNSITMENEMKPESLLDWKASEKSKDGMPVITKMDREGTVNITSVAFWGLKDGESWLSGMKGETSYPLLFTDDMGKNHVMKVS